MKIEAKDLKNLKAEFMIVTPEMAREWLNEHNRRIESGQDANRRVNHADVKRYAADIASNSWLPTNQGIGFDVEGNLFDGQHRLWGIVEAGIPAPLLVTNGFPVEYRNGTVQKTKDAVDGGRVRTIQTQWQCDRVPYSTLVSSTVRMLAITSNDFSRLKLSLAQANKIRDLYKAHIYAVIANLGKASQLRGYIAAPLVMYRAMDKESADAFAIQFNIMANLPTGSPILALARYFVNNKSTAGSCFQVTAARVVAAAIHAYAKGQKLQIVRPNADSLEWLMQGNKNSVRKVREILGLK